MSRIILILSILISGFTIAQNPGYFGKYNVFTFKYLPTLDYSTENRRAVYVDEDNLLYNNGIFKESDGSGVITKTFNFENMFQIGYARLIKRNMAVGANIGYTRLKLGTSFFYDYEFRGLESLEANTFSFEGFLEISANKSILMSSISHKFGLRFVAGSLRDKVYLGRYRNEFDFNELYTVEYTLEDITEPEEISLSGLQFIYGITLHKPLTDFMVLQYGFNINLGPSLISKNNRFRDFIGETSPEPNWIGYIDPNYVNFLFDSALFTNLVSADISLIFPF
ncbi:MAG: hypothetical protein ACPGU5_05595 [Lishizhenia sp.]